MGSERQAPPRDAAVRAFRHDRHSPPRRIPALVWIFGNFVAGNMRRHVPAHLCLAFADFDAHVEIGGAGARFLRHGYSIAVAWNPPDV